MKSLCWFPVLAVLCACSDDTAVDSADGAVDTTVDAPVDAVADAPRPDAGGDVAVPDTATVDGVDLAQADTTLPDMMTPDSPLPDLVPPDLPLPDLLQPDAPLLDVATPDIPVPDLAQPDLPLPDQLQPDMAVPDTLQPDTLAPDTVCIDTDNDTVCDQSDQCPGEDDLIDIDNNGTPDCVENLLTNGQFVSSISGWSPSSVYATLAWESSSRLQVTNAHTSKTSTTTVSADQCVNVSSGKVYTLYGAFFIASGQAATPGASYRVYRYTGTGCTGSTVPPSTGSTTWYSPVGAWAVRITSVHAPSSAKSVRIRLGVTKPPNTPDVTILYDNMLLH